LRFLDEALDILTRLKQFGSDGKSDGEVNRAAEDMNSDK
jgi:hypothetical protein